MKRKKSFILHNDISTVLEEYDNEEKGIIFQSIVDYHNGKYNHETAEKWLRRVMRPLINIFERDNEKYENICERNKKNGSKGGRPRKQENPQEPKKPSGLFGNPTKPKKADSDSDSDSDSVSNTDIEYIYSLYPTKCPNRKQSNGKSSKNKNKIKDLIKSGEYTVEQLTSIINRYVDDCKRDGSYMKNFSTFLNNIPDYETDSPNDTPKSLLDVPSSERVKKINEDSPLFLYR